MCKARPIWCRLLAHFIRLAAARTFWTAGSKRLITTAMMAMTTSNSISVKPVRRVCIEGSLAKDRRNRRYVVEDITMEGESPPRPGGACLGGSRPAALLRRVFWRLAVPDANPHRDFDRQEDLAAPEVKDLL